MPPATPAPRAVTRSPVFEQALIFDTGPNDGCSALRIIGGRGLCHARLQQIQILSQLPREGANGNNESSSSAFDWRKAEGEGRSFSPLSQQLLECRRRIRRPVAILDDYWAGDLEVVRHCKWSFCGAASRHDDCIARDDQRAFI